MRMVFAGNRCRRPAFANQSMSESESCPKMNRTLRMTATYPWRRRPQPRFGPPTLGHNPRAAKRDPLTRRSLGVSIVESGLERREYVGTAREGGRHVGAEVTRRATDAPRDVDTLDDDDARVTGAFERRLDRERARRGGHDRATTIDGHRGAPRPAERGRKPQPV